MSIKELSPQEAYDLANQGVIFVDVREKNETDALRYALLNIVYLPMSELQNTFSAKLPQDKKQPIILACRSGARSMNAALFLEENGYSDLSNLKGGILGWGASLLPCMEGAENTSSNNKDHC